MAGPRKFTDANLEGVSTFLSTSLLHDENNTVNSLCDSLEKLVLYSKSKSTWTKHMTAWNLVEQFFRHSNNKFTNVLDIKQARAFVVWALEKRGLKPSTVKSYLYSIKLAHCLSGKEHVDFAKDTVIQMALKGADNLYELEMQNNKIRLAMDISTLKILGHRIAKSDWTKLSKQVVWTACLVSFFTSCRMGELLADTEKSFDPTTTLAWKHVSSTDSCGKTIFLPYTKTTGLKGKTAEIFFFKDETCCPVLAMDRLESLSKLENIYNPDLPVFGFKSKFLTVNKLNIILKNFLSDFNTDGMSGFSCHSFRSAIPNLLSSHPTDSSIEDIKQWGGWDSTSYKKYTKNDRDRRKELFGKVVSLM